MGVVTDREYVVEAVAPNPREWSNSYGEFLSYKVRFAGDVDTKPVEISQKKTTKAPVEGDRLLGTIAQDDNGFRKFKKAQQQGGGGKGGGRSPAEQKAILRQGSQNRAIDYVRMLHDVGELKIPEGGLWPLVQKIADSMCTDVDSYVKSSTGGTT